MAKKRLKPGQVQSSMIATIQQHFGGRLNRRWTMTWHAPYVVVDYARDGTRLTPVYAKVTNGRLVQEPPRVYSDNSPSYRSKEEAIEAARKMGFGSYKLLLNPQDHYFEWQWQKIKIEP